MILIADDKQENIFSLKSILESHSFPVDTALSGEEVLKKVLKNSYALIILDVQMPGMDGFEVAEMISGHSKAKDTPIIFLSAVNTDKKFITRGYNTGGIDYIVKPIDVDILLLKVRTFCTLYEQTHQLNEMQQALRSEIEYRKKAQAEIQEKALELQSILESIPQIAFTTQANGKIEFVNKHWFDYSSSIHEFPATHPEDINIGSQWEKMITGGQVIQLEVRVRKIDHPQYRYHLLKVVPAREGNAVVRWVGTFTDIEDQKQAIRKKDEFISIASHELKTPLTSIKAYVQLLERMITQDTLKQYIERTLFQVEKLDNLIADLLDISKIENGKLKLNKQHFSFEATLSGALEMIRQMYPARTVTRKGTANVTVYGDEARIEQVIINYLTNAIKYSPDPSEVEVNVATARSQIEVAVKDSGIGIAPEDQSSIFSKFYRVDDSASRIQGLGIGLYICAEILKRHQGIYGVNSEPGKGSTFYFSIPFEQYC